ncbi:MAG: hypothetical protein LUG18_14070 [Candidatus Azobacteroides sp.]|nr:hypothetical protein [Candidatus Azobacteroides sp.]
MNFLLNLHTNIIEALKKKILPEQYLSDVLVELLSINKAAAYRRIEGKVPFSIKEMAILARDLGISLDELIRSNSLKNQQLILRTIEHIHPGKEDFELLESYIELLDKMNTFPDSRIEGVTNIIPALIYMEYDYLTKYYLFKWAYQYGHVDKNIPYTQMTVNEKYRKIQKKLLFANQSASSTYLIFDPLTFYYLANDLRYFFNLGLISEEDLILIQQDLFAVLEDLEWMCDEGKFRDTGKEVNIYVSQINFHTNYSYVYTGTLYLSLIKTFLVNDLYALHPSVYEQIKMWLHSFRRYSTLISQSGQYQRMQFLNTQREIVENITNKEVPVEEFLPKI